MAALGEEVTEGMGLESWFILLLQEMQCEQKVPVGLLQELTDQVHDDLAACTLCLPASHISVPLWSPSFHQVSNRNVAIQARCPLCPDICDV